MQRQRLLAGLQKILGKNEYLCFPAPDPNLYLTAPAANLYLTTLALNLYLPAPALNLCLPVLRFTVKVCYSYVSAYINTASTYMH